MPLLGVVVILATIESKWPRTTEKLRAQTFHGPDHWSVTRIDARRDALSYLARPYLAGTKIRWPA